MIYTYISVQAGTRPTLTSSITLLCKQFTSACKCGLFISYWLMYPGAVGHLENQTNRTFKTPERNVQYVQDYARMRGFTINVLIYAAIPPHGMRINGIANYAGKWANISHMPDFDQELVLMAVLHELGHLLPGALPETDIWGEEVRAWTNAYELAQTLHIPISQHMGRFATNMLNTYDKYRKGVT